MIPATFERIAALAAIEIERRGGAPESRRWRLLCDLEKPQEVEPLAADADVALLVRLVCQDRPATPGESVGSALFATPLHDEATARVKELGSRVVRWLPPGGALLDFGGGWGDLVAQVLGADAAARAVLVDREASAIAAARQRLAGFGERARFELGDEHFDVVVASNVLHFLRADEAEATLARLAGLLAKGGRLVVVEPIWDARYALQVALAIADGTLHRSSWLAEVARALGLRDVRTIPMLTAPRSAIVTGTR